MNTERIYEHDIFINQNNPYMFNKEIIEYDMKEAGFSLIKEYNLLGKNEIKYLEKLSKDRRTVSIGMMERTNKELVKNKKEAFKEARRMFFEANNININDIISIKKDAIFLNKRIQHTKFKEYIDFRLKNTYSSYIYLGKKLEIYYSSYKTDVKGISDEKLESHNDYMLDIINKFINKCETSTSENSLEFLKRMVSKYKRRELDFGYYRTFDNRSVFEVDVGPEIVLYPELHGVNMDNKELLIDYNFRNIFLKLFKIPL